MPKSGIPGAPEVATFLIKGVDHHKNDCIPVIADFVLCGEKDQSKHEHGLAKSGIKRLNISPNKYTVYLYSTCVRS